MNKKLKGAARSHRAYVQNFVARLEEKRSRGWTEADIDRILRGMESEDEAVRAAAVREICPCRMPDELFFKLRAAAKRLQHDSSPIVRESARHIEEDARMVASFEAQAEHWAEESERPEARSAKPRRRRGQSGIGLRTRPVR